MNLPAASCGVSKGRISILIPLTLTLSRRGEREPKVTLQRATGNYQVQLIFTGLLFFDEPHGCNHGRDGCALAKQRFSIFRKPKIFHL